MQKQSEKFESTTSQTIESKNYKDILETISFCTVVDVLLLLVWFFYNKLSNSFIAVAVPGIFVTLLFTFIICFIVSLIYATRVKRFSWMAFIPLLVNTITIFGIIYLIQTKSR